MRKFGVVLMMVALAACASDEGKKDASKVAAAHEQPSVQKAQAENLVCPQVAILREAEESFDYGGDAPEPSQLVAKARLNKIDGDCSYRKDGIDVSFTLYNAAARGPRLGSQVSFPYFIAIVDPSEAILSRQVVTASYLFSASDKVVESKDKLHVFIPLSLGAQQAGPDYRVLIGFLQQAAPSFGR